MLKTSIKSAYLVLAFFAIASLVASLYRLDAWSRFRLETDAHLSANNDTDSTNFDNIPAKKLSPYDVIEMQKAEINTLRRIINETGITTDNGDGNNQSDLTGKLDSLETACLDAAAEQLKDVKSKLHESDFKLLQMQMENERFRFNNMKDQAKPDEKLEPSGEKVVIITAYSDDFVQKFPNITKQMLSNRELYTKTHGYDNLIINLDKYVSETNKKTSKVWFKLNAIKEAMERRPNAEWFFWADADAIFMEPEIDLASHILNPDVLNSRLSYNIPMARVGDVFDGEYYFGRGKIDVKDIELILTHDKLTLNAGMILFKRTPFIMDTFMKIWMDPKWQQKKYSRAEQDALIDIVFENEDVRNRLGIVPQILINSYWDGYSITPARYHDGDFIYHFAGRSSDPNYFTSLWNDAWSKYEKKHGDKTDDADGN